MDLFQIILLKNLQFVHHIDSRLQKKQNIPMKNYLYFTTEIDNTMDNTVQPDRKRLHF